MRIALVYDAVFPWRKGGAEMHIEELSNELVKCGHDVRIVAMGWWGEEAIFRREGKVYHRACKAVDIYGRRDRRRIRPALRFAAGALCTLRRLDVDLIDCCAFPYFPGLALALARRSLPAPLTVTWFEVWGEHFQEYLGVPGLAARAVEKALIDRDVPSTAISPLTADRLHNIRPEAVCRVIPSGVYLPDVATGPRVQGRLGWAGRALPHKNLPLALEALVHLPEFELHVLGDGPCLDDWKALACVLGVADRVKWLGFLPDPDDVVRFLGSCEVVLQTSQREGMGRVAVEAAALKTPLVLVDHPLVATASFFEHGVSARIVGPDRSRGREIAAEVREARANGRSLGEHARLVAESVSWPVVIEQVLDHYEQVVSGAWRNRSSAH